MISIALAALPLIAIGRDPQAVGLFPNSNTFVVTGRLGTGAWLRVQ